MPLFGGHYRSYRFAVALRRLKDMPPGTLLTLTKAAHLLGVNEASLRRLVARHAPTTALRDNKISATILLHVIRMAYEIRKKGL